MSRRWISVFVAAVIAVVLGVLVPRAFAAEDRAQPVWREAQLASQQVLPQAPAVPRAPIMEEPLSLLTVPFEGEFLGWAMQDKQTGTLTGENLDETSSTESMVKTWLVADYLRQVKGQPSTYYLGLASEALRWSDDDAAETLYQESGADESIERMISMCGLVDTTVYDGWWSRTQMSPRDAVNLGDCLGDGTAAGPKWTSWVLDEMRSVEGSTAAADQEQTRGGGRWGIIDGVPAAQAGSVAIKNGWTSIQADGNWHLNCLALTDDWTMSVMMRYPAELGLDYGSGVCQSIARQLLT
jgi:hypothetical protein